MSDKRIHLSIDFTKPTGEQMRYSGSVILYELEIEAMGGISSAHEAATRSFEHEFVRYLQKNGLFYGSSIGHLRSVTKDYSYQFLLPEEARVEAVSAI